MANTFIHAAGGEVGASLWREVSGRHRAHHQGDRRGARCAIVLPVDGVVAENSAAKRAEHVGAGGQDPARPHDARRRPAEHALFAQHIAARATIVWNGPVGAFEITPFDAGTNAVARPSPRRRKRGAVQRRPAAATTVAALATPASPRR